MTPKTFFCHFSLHLSACKFAIFAKQLLSFIFLLTILSSCKIYHNTTARYNAYFMAKERMLEAEATLFGTPKDNFNDIIYLYPKIDSNQTKSQKATFDFIVKRASLPIQQHPSSKWVDYCYLLIGKTRLYEGNNQDAINTFKYVNTESNNPDARHKALNWLMRAFIEAEDWRSVEYVANFMSQEPLISNQNARDFYLNFSHYYRIRKQYPQAIAYLEKALPDVKGKEFRRRCLFLLAQLHQNAGNSAEAYKYYTKLLRKNPSYEMEFAAKLRASGSVDFANADAVKKGEKYLQKLLKDGKNVDLKHKIYYEMANLEVGRKNYDKALEYLLESVYYSKADKDQKFSSFLRAGEIAFDNKKDMNMAAAYYDSALRFLNPKAENVKAFNKKHKVLQLFATQFNNMKTADRLLVLAAMNESEREEYLKGEIDKEKAEIDKQIITERKRAETRKKDSVQTAALQQNNATFNTVSQNNANAGFANTGAVSNTLFHFYQPNTTLQTSKQNFYREWGERPLVDNWRLVSKIPAAAMASFNLNADANNNGNAQASKDTKNAPTEQEIRYATLKTKEDRLAEVPANKAEVTNWTEKLQTSLFVVGKMYYEEFGQQESAIEHLQRFTNKFPPHKNTPEALYILQKICIETKKCKPDAFQKRLREEFPKSVYAKLLDNKDFVKESNKFNTEASKLYENAYTAYQLGNYAQANEGLKEIRAKYAENGYMDKVTLLETMLLAKTSKEMSAVKQSLEDFLELYKDSDLREFATTMLKNIK
jgi:tetratricopeptide (TPR) repeat protein